MKLRLQKCRPMAFVEVNAELRKLTDLRGETTVAGRGQHELSDVPQPHLAFLRPPMSCLFISTGSQGSIQSP
jgi:hypothetical protein